MEEGVYDRVKALAQEREQEKEEPGDPHSNSSDRSTSHLA